MSKSSSDGGPRNGEDPPAAPVEDSGSRAADAPSASSVAQSFATARPVAVGVVFLAAVVFGWLSYFRLPVTLMPELSYPTITVRTEYPGAAPEEVENEVSRPIEETLGVIAGLRKVSSISRADVSDVVLEFSWDMEMTDAVQDTLEKLDQVLLPEDAERPLVLRFDPSLDPVMELSLGGVDERFEGEEGLRRLRRIGELQIKRALEPIKGVAAVQVRGGLEEEIHVLLNERELERSGLSVFQVIQRLAQENINLAGGSLKEGTTEYMVRTLNEYRDLDEIAATVITRFEGKEVRLRDLGQVVRAHKDRQILTHADGLESVQLEVYKEADANMVALSARVENAIGDWTLGQPPEEGEEEEASGEEARGGRAGRGGPGGAQPLPLAARLFRDEGVKLQVVVDRSEFIESSIRELRVTAIIGGLLAVVVLYLFLGSARTTAIIAVSIPASLLITFAPLNILGLTINIMSLGGLALGVGMLVDSSIVVLESIFRCREEGDDLVTSVVRGTAEVKGAVIASTLTSIAVFFPMVFVEGVAGQAFGDLGLAVIVSLLAALAVALYLIPMLAARRGLQLETAGSDFRLVRLRAHRAFVDDLRAWGWVWKIVLFPYLLVRLVLGIVFELLGVLALVAFVLVGFLLKLAVRWVGRPLGALLRRGPLYLVDKLLGVVHRTYARVLARAVARPVTVLALVAVCLALTVWIFGRLDNELLPEVHQGELTVELALPPGTPLEETLEILMPVERAILDEKGHIESLIVTYGFDPTQTQGAEEGEHTARFKVVLEVADASTEEAVIARLRRRFAAIPDLDQGVSRPVLFSFKTPIEVEVHGESLAELKRYGERVEAVMAAMPALADVQTTLKTGAPEVEIVYDRELLARYELNIGDVAERIRSLVRGDEATLFNLKDRRIPIVVRLAEQDRRTVEDIRNLAINEGHGPTISLAAVADVTLGEGPSEVRRIDGRRVALVRANIAQGSLGSAVAGIERELARQIDWPADMTFIVAGQQEEWERSADSLWLALALSIFLVYVIMAAQFESLLYPFIILFTIPLAFFGTGIALVLLGTSLSVVVFLGMIMLAGIVVNNAIVLVDYANLLKARGLARLEAIQTAGEVRLRPILMTTATTVLGLLPMALGAGDGAELRTPMAIAVISGLLVSTLLTLVAIPALYSLLDGIKEHLTDRRRERRGVDGEAEAELPEPEASPS